MRICKSFIQNMSKLCTHLKRTKRENFTAGCYSISKTLSESEPMYEFSLCSRWKTKWKVNIGVGKIRGTHVIPDKRWNVHPGYDSRATTSVGNRQWYENKLGLTNIISMFRYYQNTFMNIYTAISDTCAYEEFSLIHRFSNDELLTSRISWCRIDVELNIRYHFE